MSKINFNISGCQEKIGWQKSILYTGEDSKWLNFFGDVREDANKFINEQNNFFYRLIFASTGNDFLGIAFSSVVENKADARGGYLQVSLLVENGSRLAAKSIISILDEAHRALADKEKINGLFDNNAEVCNELKNILNGIINTYEPEVRNDYNLASSFKMVDKPNLDLRFRVYRDDAELEDLLNFPHQSVYTTHRTICFVPQSAESKSKEEFPPIQHVITIKDKEDNSYDALEGTTQEIPLYTYKHIDSAEHSVSVQAGDNGKDKPYVNYDKQNNLITIDESKFPFTRTVKFIVHIPDLPKYSEKSGFVEELTKSTCFTLNKSKLVEVSSDKIKSGKFDLDFEKVPIDSKVNLIFQLGAKSDYLKIEGEKVEVTSESLKEKDCTKEIILKYKMCRVPVTALYEGKLIPLNCKEEGKKQSLSPVNVPQHSDKKEKGDGSNYQFFDLSIGSKYTFFIKENSEEAKNFELGKGAEITIDEKSAYLSNGVSIEVKLKTSKLIIKLGDDKIIGESRFFKPTKFYHGYPVKPIEGKERLYEVKVGFYKLLTYVFAALSLFFLCLYIFHARGEVKQLINERDKYMQECDSLKNMQTPVDSLNQSVATPDNSAKVAPSTSDSTKQDTMGNSNNNPGKLD